MKYSDDMNDEFFIPDGRADSMHDSYRDDYEDYEDYEDEEDEYDYEDMDDEEDDYQYEDFIEGQFDERDD